MNPITTALAAGALIIGGKWARSQAPTLDNAIGIAGIAIILAIIEQMNPKFSKAFGVLIVISVAVVHLPAIVKGAGFSGSIKTSNGKCSGGGVGHMNAK